MGEVGAERVDGREGFLGQARGLVFVGREREVFEGSQWRGHGIRLAFGKDGWAVFQYPLNSKYMLDVVLSVSLLSHLFISKMTLRNRYTTN